MATYRELKFSHRIFVQNYPFERFAIEDNPAARLTKPLSKCKFALVTSAGLRLESDAPFDHTKRSSDVSFREIPAETDVNSLIEDHKSTAFDHAGINIDKNLALPLDRFRELVARGEIGSLNGRSFSFMGSIVNPKNLISETAPRVARLLKDDEVDAVFLTPV